jgi:hypothetical protein
VFCTNSKHLCNEHTKQKQPLRSTHLSTMPHTSARAGHAEIDPSDEHFAWRAVDDELIEPFSRSPTAIVHLALRYDLCVTGDGLAHCARAGIADVVVGCSQARSRLRLPCACLTRL